MSALLWIAVGAVAGIAAALLARSLARARPVPDGSGTQAASPVPQAWAASRTGEAVRVRLAAEDLAVIREDIQKLHVVRTDLHRVGDLLERILEDMMEFRATHSPRPEPTAGPVRGLIREPVRDTSPNHSPSLDAALRRVDRDLHVGREPHGAGYNPILPGPAPVDPGWSAPAAAEPAGPPPGAAHVEASNDVVISSERHPPEAWLERRGGDAEVYLNPRVTLTDPALQRWSTFFDWERREPGARYQATRPAVVSPSGSVVRKGMARPL